MIERSVTVRMPAIWLWLIRVGGAVLGCALGFVVGPFVRWLMGLIGEAPGPLWLAAQLPTVWAVPALTVAGTVAGAWVAMQARRQSPVVTVDRDHVLLQDGTFACQLGRERVGAVFTDGRELVVLDDAAGELARIRAADLPTGRLRGAFERFGYPWRGTADPREAEFVRWVDGTPDLEPAIHALLRARKRAIDDKLPGAADNVLDELRASGVAVRDRGGVQQYRRAGTATAPRPVTGQRRV
jgi:hypothetical protein